MVKEIADDAEAPTDTLPRGSTSHSEVSSAPVLRHPLQRVANVFGFYQLTYDIDGPHRVPEHWGTPAGEPYNPKHAARRSGRFHLTLPQNSYGALMAAVVMMENHNWRSYLPIQYTLSPVLLTLVLQGALIYYIGELVHIDERDGVTCSAGGAHFLRFVCVTIFVAQTLNAVRESQKMGMWLHSVPHHTEKMTEFKVQEFEKDDIKVVKPVSGMPRKMWYLLWICIVFPKFALEVLLVIYGAAYISFMDTNEKLIRGVVGLFFVNTVDDIIFKYAVGPLTKETLTSLPAISMNQTEVHERGQDQAETLRAFLWIPFLLVLTTILTLAWCN